ncbi:MAG TPA: hypothetical protein VJY36_05655 [Candidatus Bathyarchaeia archaeon]|nr:hypothetical protein [Candidatus Bathyarchaeia archaeon]
MVYTVDYAAGERAGCSSKITIADRIFYVKLFSAAKSLFFSGDQKGVIQKEISKTEFELWINILADSEADAVEIGQKLSIGKKY